MDLKEFVAETLRQLVDAVVEAQQHAESHDAFINPADITDVLGGKPYGHTVKVPGKGPDRRFVQFVEFDVALTTAKAEQSKAGLGLLNVVSAGLSKQTGDTEEAVSRVKFAIPLALPLHGGRAPKTNPPQPAQRPQQ